MSLIKINWQVGTATLVSGPSESERTIKRLDPFEFFARFREGLRSPRGAPDFQRGGDRTRTGDVKLEPPGTPETQLVECLSHRWCCYDPGRITSAMIQDRRPPHPSEVLVEEAWRALGGGIDDPPLEMVASHMHEPWRSERLRVEVLPLLGPPSADRAACRQPERHDTSDSDPPHRQTGRTHESKTPTGEGRAKVQRLGAQAPGMYAQPAFCARMSA